MVVADSRPTTSGASRELAAVAALRPSAGARVPVQMPGRGRSFVRRVQRLPVWGRLLLNWALGGRSSGGSRQLGFVSRILREVADIVDLIAASDGTNDEAAQAREAADVDRRAGDRFAALMSSDFAPQLGDSGSDSGGARPAAPPGLGGPYQ